MSKISKNNTSSHQFQLKDNDKNNNNFQKSSKNLSTSYQSHPKSKPKTTLLPKRLKDLRIERKLSQSKLAQKVGVTKQSISGWERSNPLAFILKDNLEKLARALTCTPDFLQGKTEKTNLYITDDGKIEGIIGMPLSLRPLINERISLYSDEQLNFLYEFLFSFETYTSSQLELFQRISSVIAATIVPKLTAYHPLCSSDSFQKIFHKTKKAIAKIQEDLNQPGSSARIKQSLDDLNASILLDYNSLSYCLQSKEHFKKSLRHITNGFKLFIDSLSELDLSKENLDIMQEAYFELLNKSLDDDISSLFHNIK